jgi:hypothetical protein
MKKYAQRKDWKNAGMKVLQSHRPQSYPDSTAI